MRFSRGCLSPRSPGASPTSECYFYVSPGRSQLHEKQNKLGYYSHGSFLRCSEETSTNMRSNSMMCVKCLFRTRPVWELYPSRHISVPTLRLNKLMMMMISLKVILLPTSDSLRLGVGVVFEKGREKNWSYLLYFFLMDCQIWTQLNKTCRWWYYVGNLIIIC